jgi:CheY-like chemotaxis protein
MLAAEIRTALRELEEAAPGTRRLQLVRWAASPWVVRWALGSIPELGLHATEVSGEAASLWASVAPEDRDRLRGLFGSLDEAAVVEYRIRHDGELRWVRESVRRVECLEGGVALVSVLRDLTLERALSDPDRPPSAGLPGSVDAGPLVLVVEDDPHVRTVIGRILTRKGYGVLQAASSAEALRLCERAPGSIRLLVADVILPDRPGPELARLLQKRVVDLRTIFVSGYSAEDLGARARLPADALFLAKPFRAHELGDLVDRVMARRTGGGGAVEGPRSAV